MIVLALLDGNLLGVGLEAYIRDLQGVAALFGSLDGECAGGAGNSIGHDLFTRKKGSRGLNHCFLCILFNNFSCNCALGTGGDNHRTKGYQ